jgi:outer membrane autotransporter protein
MAYHHLSQDSYTETGAPGANLTVDSVDTYSARSGLGGKIAANFGSYEGWVFTPNARAAWLHEFNDQAPDMTTTYAAAGGTTFTTNGLKMATEAAQIGVGLDMASCENLTVSLKYDAEVKDKFDSHTGLLQVRAEF